MWLAFLLLLTLNSLVLSGDFCIRGVENDTNEPYLSYALLRTVEKAILESGGRLNCRGKAEEVSVRVVRFEEKPISYTPRQRVNSYNLYLTFEVRVGERKFSLSGVVPYSLPSGGLGDIPRRKAIDDLLDKIYWNILQNLRR